MTQKNYVPAQEELRQSRNILDRLIPNDEIFHNYDMRAAFYLDIMPELSRCGKKLVNIVEKIRLLESDLFRHKYLVGYVDHSWFKKTASHYDSFVSVIEYSNMRIPIVVIPNHQKLIRHITEHEFVHVNQILLGSEPSICRYPEDIVENFFRSFQNEYEANFLQFIRWPKFYPIQSGVSLERWCLLRGFSQGLEKSCKEMVTILSEPKDIENVLTLIKGKLPEKFKLIGANEGELQGFIERFTAYLGISLAVVLEDDPNLRNNESFVALVRWLQNHASMMEISLLKEIDSDCLLTNWSQLDNI